MTEISLRDHREGGRSRKDADAVPAAPLHPSAVTEPCYVNTLITQHGLFGGECSSQSGYFWCFGGQRKEDGIKRQSRKSVFSSFTIYVYIEYLYYGVTTLAMQYKDE